MPYLRPDPRWAQFFFDFARASSAGCLRGNIPRPKRRRWASSYGLCSYGLCSYGLHTYGLCNYGLYSYGPCSYGLCSYGICSYGAGPRSCVFAVTGRKVFWSAKDRFFLFYFCRSSGMGRSIIWDPRAYGMHGAAAWVPGPQQFPRHNNVGHYPQAITM